MLRLSRYQLHEIDRRAVSDYHIPSVVLMENAARAVVAQACRMMANACCGKVLILCGSGNNGGDGLAVARHLSNYGAEVMIGLAIDPGKFKGDALINWKIVRAMGISALPFDESMLENPKPMLVIDAIFGTGLSSAPREPFGRIAEAVNRSGLPVLAVDVPSGLDCETGSVPGACIRADFTVTLVAEKVGYVQEEARSVLGEVIVGDIGCPASLILSAGVLAGVEGSGRE